MTNIQGQPCSAMYHSQFISKSGDTINNVDNNGFYNGLHIYTDNENNIYNDTTNYLKGFYKHGKPIGKWLKHCRDGTFSIGEYDIAEETTMHPDGSIETKKQGTGKPIGIWEYYDSDNSLIKKELYDFHFDKKGWTKKTYNVKEHDTILTIYSFNSKHTLKSPFKKQVDRVYNLKGQLLYESKLSFWVNYSKTYYDTGELKKVYKCRKLFGFKINTAIKKEFNRDGDLIKKEKNDCWYVIE